MIYHHNSDYNILKVKSISENEYNRDIWAFAYKEDDRATNYMCKPVKGVIRDDRYFYRYKSNGNGLNKYGRSIFSRYFADTYEEAVQGFNQLVNLRIKHLYDEIEKANELLIE